VVPPGQGVIPTRHPLAVSFTEGHGLWKTADVVLAVGTRVYWQQANWGWMTGLPWCGWISVASTSFPWNDSYHATVSSL
jgi:thiamine pyrophosphate-dependent acetolactate synthase large subunit-like protein